MKYITTINESEYEIEIGHDNEITVNGEKYAIDFQQIAEGGILSLLLNNRSLEGIVEERGTSWEVLIHGELYNVQVQDERAYRLAKARGGTTTVTGEVTIQSPMPGLIVSVPISEGAAVTAGQTVVILESMKMENELRSPRDGVIMRVSVQPGASVEKGQTLVTIGDAAGQ
jgi:biotin carboxyl carrier protein